ncbi:MAG: DUF421 domain-containing protein [Peptococcaceae bacterium]|nr:DUF421 domain-containing protein [Peptococcaceae bacterium]
MWKLMGRSLATFIFATILLRMAGRKSLARLNYFDYIMVNLMGGVLGNYVVGQAKGPMVLAAPAFVTAASVISEKAAAKNRQVRNVLQGQPLIIIQNGRVIRSAMGKARYNMGELLMALREKGVFDPAEVEFAVLENDGSLGVQKKSQLRPATPCDFKMGTQYEGISSVLVSDGEILENNLIKNNLDQGWLNTELKNNGVKDLSEVFLASLATDGSLYVDVRASKTR